MNTRRLAVAPGSSGLRSTPLTCIFSCIFACILFSLDAAAVLAAERTIPYKDMHRVFERLERFKGGTYMKVMAKLSSAEPDQKPQDIRLVIQAKAGDIPVPVAADGTVDFPVRADLLAENPAIVTNVPEGKLSVGVSPSVEAPPQQRFRYGLGDTMREEAKTMIARQGMVARFMMPSFDEFVVQFEKGHPASATIEATSGPVRLDADADGLVIVPNRRDWRKEDPFVQLSEAPLRIILQPKK